MGFSKRLAEAVEVDGDDLREAGFVIGARGLEKPSGGKLNILPKRVYWMGASSSPSMVFVTAVKGDSVSYLNSPFDGSPRRMQKWVAKDLIDKGTRTHLKMYGQHMDKRLKRSLEDMLDGGAGKSEKLADYQLQYALVRPAKEGEDLWREAERYGGVGGVEVDGVMHYEIRLSGAALRELRANKKFVVVKTDKKGVA